VTKIGGGSKIFENFLKNFAKKTQSFRLLGGHPPTPCLCGFNFFEPDVFILIREMIVIRVYPINHVITIFKILKKLYNSNKH
jgi:hypothetical protein